jgi:tripartite-type tricarboxylate transporter receptor subunit TctC
MSTSGFLRRRPSFRGWPFANHYRRLAYSGHVTSAQRFSDLPDLPTLAEAGVPGYEATSWYGFLGPAGLPPDIVAKLNRELIKIVQNPAMKEKFASLGIEPVTGTPDEFGAYIRSEMVKWRAVVTAADIKVN